MKASRRHIFGHGYVRTPSALIEPALHPPILVVPSAVVLLRVLTVPENGQTEMGGQGLARIGSQMLGFSRIRIAAPESAQMKLAFKSTPIWLPNCFQQDAGAHGLRESLGYWRALPLFAPTGSYQHYWTPVLRSNATFGFVQVQNTAFQPGNTYHKAIYSSVNLIWNPLGSIDVGAELIYGWVQNKNGAHSDAPRIQFTGRYRFVKHQQE